MNHVRIMFRMLAFFGTAMMTAGLQQGLMPATFLGLTFMMAGAIGGWE